MKSVLNNIKKRLSIFNREFITKKEWGRLGLFKRVIFPLLLFSSVILLLLGNFDTTFLVINAILLIYFLKVYTKRKNIEINKTNKFKRLREVFNVLFVILGVLILVDNVGYTIAMGKIQFNNEGYVTVSSLRKGVKDGEVSFYANEIDKEEDKIYQHVFKGSEYLSKVDITEEIEEEFKKGENELENGYFE